MYEPKQEAINDDLINLEAKQIERLPEYVAIELNRLASNMRDQSRRAAQAQGEEDSRIHLGLYRPGLTYRSTPLPEDTITFRLGEDAIDVRLGEDRLGEFLTVNSDTTVAVSPVTSNVVRVRNVRW